MSITTEQTQQINGSSLDQVPGPAATGSGTLPHKKKRSLYVSQNRPPRPVERTPRKSRLDVYLAFGLTAVVMVLLAWNITGFPNASDDEGTYLAQAWAVQQGQGLAHYTYWYDHPPVGWIQLAGLSWLPAWLAPDLVSVAGGRIAMLPVIAASLLLIYTIVRRLGFARWTAALALLVFGLSPLAVTMNRQIYLDSFAVVWMLGALALALSPRRHLWHFAAAGAATAISVLSKETMLITMPAVVIALWQNGSRTSTRPWGLGAYVSGLVLVGIFYPLYALLRGELFPGAGHTSLIGAIQFQLLNRDGTGSAFAEGSGSYALIESWLYYDAVILIGGLAATAIAVFVRRLRGPAVAAVILAIVGLRPGGYMPAMYVVQALPFFAILIAGVIGVGAERLQPLRARWRVPVMVLAALLAAVVVVPRWYEGNERAVTTQANAEYEQAADFLRTRIPDRADATVVLDDVLWLDAVNAGYQQQKVIWFYKLDLDPAVQETLPNGWRDVDYLVSSPALRQNPEGLPLVSALLTNSTPIATFGSGDARIELRQVDKETP